ncbi:hypothetical protein CMT92_00170 [Elizabethkingia anophelis]|nr:hypothetical protein [Elizabethkingia anophelis]
MNIKPLIVKSYLESLTEENELNRIFPILLTSMGFDVLSKPTENKGLTEYGKDIVAVGKDEDGIKKRFYFELKGGKDRDVTKDTFYKEYGIMQSLTASNYVNFSSSYKGFNKLPKKIILVHNGVLNGKIREEYEAFILKIFPEDGDTEYERWGIEKLTTLFTDSLFGAYLLTDQDTTKIFNKVLINLNASNHISEDFNYLLNHLFQKNEWKETRYSLSRKWVLFFQTLKLIAFVIYTEAKDYNNLDIAKRYITHLLIKYWHWILKNKLENNSKITYYFNEVLHFYLSVLSEYFQRTLTIARIQNGLSSEKSGRYEQIGYTKRTFEYLEFLTFILNVDLLNPNSDKETIKKILTSIINANSVSCRPLVDINSIPIIDILNLYIFLDDRQSAVNYLKGVLSYIINGKTKYGRMPDANNSYENIIRFTITGEKPVYYSDSTSPLLAVLLEYTVILNLEEEYVNVKRFVIENKIDLGIFTPHHGINSTSKHLIENIEEDLDEQLFSNPALNDGYQRNIRLSVNFEKEMTFEEFKQEYQIRTDEFSYEYRTDKAGYSYLRNLAHIYFQIPYFPDKWRTIKLKESDETE